MMDAESDREAYSAEFDLNGKMIDFKNVDKNSLTEKILLRSF